MYVCQGFISLVVNVSGRALNENTSQDLLPTDLPLHTASRQTKATSFMVEWICDTPHASRKGASEDVFFATCGLFIPLQHVGWLTFDVGVYTPNLVR